MHPNVCNICGGNVIYTDNANIYGRPYGSGKFNKQWNFREKKVKKRHMAYKKLANGLGVSESACHFGYSGKEMPKRAYNILLGWQ